MVGRARTPLLLAFGEHPIWHGEVALEADKRFFRSQVVPFLDEQVVKKGKRAVIIHEYNVGFPLDGQDRGNERDAEAVITMVSEIETHVLALLRQRLNLGMELGQESSWFDWGYLHHIIETNRQKPNSILSIIEPLKAETVWLMWEQELVCRRQRATKTPEEILELEKEILRYSMRVCYERSMRVVRLAHDLREEDPERAIVIARGFAHSGMMDRFDQADFDKTVASHMRGAPRFSSEAIIRSFQGELSEAELTRYAHLCLSYNSYYESNWERFVIESRTDNGIDEDKLRLLSVEARKHALTQSSPAHTGTGTLI